MKLNLDTILKYTTITETGCMEWTRCLNTDGYPRALIQGNANAKVHREVYALTNPQEDITTKVIRHSCDNPKCINPKHLLSGSPKDNMQDRDNRDRHGAKKLTHKDVLVIRTLFNNKTYSTKELASMFKVTYNTIRYSLFKRKVGT